MSNKTILITGGAGYIGSHVAKQLLETGEEIIILDNLSTGFMDTVDVLQNIKPFEFVNLDLKEFDKVEELFRRENIDVVIHFAAFSQVAESMKNPMKYYMNNTVNTANLVRCASKYGVKKFIFSSTAVEDRAGHDRRYAIDASKIEDELEWRAEENFDSGIVKTVEWYLKNSDFI